MLVETKGTDILAEFSEATKTPESHNPLDYHEDKLTKYFIRAGVDSRVYKSLNGLWVLKFYNVMRNMHSALQLKYYQEITNRLAGQSLRENWTIPVGDQTLPMIINSYDYLIFSTDHNCWVGICPFIPGTHIDRQVNMLKLEDVRKSLNLFSAFICNKAHVQGLQLEGPNVKVTWNPTKVTITDLCVSIDALEPDE